MGVDGRGGVQGASGGVGQGGVGHDGALLETTVLLFLLLLIFTIPSAHLPPRGVPAAGDGTNDNFSWNCGVEGRTDNAAIAALRQRQMRNMHLALMVSQGTPMLLIGGWGGVCGVGWGGLLFGWCQHGIAPHVQP